MEIDSTYVFSRKNNSCMKKRSHPFWVDILRGFLILLVILGHAFQKGDYNNSIIWNAIYSFHMAAFFVLSGWISYKPNPLGINSVIKRAKSLIGPLVIWSIIKILIKFKPKEYLNQAWQFFYIRTRHIGSCTHYLPQ